jgi:hypothetical protein
VAIYLDVKVVMYVPRKMLQPECAVGKRAEKLGYNVYSAFPLPERIFDTF